jgi:isopenicillin N synthase-like dioxygenase
LSIEILKVFEFNLQLSKDCLLNHHSEEYNTLRILHYPKSTEKVKAGSHSDYGSITLLFQDLIGGLEILNQEEWMPIEGIEYEDTFPIIINSGDLMEIWTNKKYPSVKHRVMGTKRNEIESRYSIAYFCHPDRKSEIETFDSCLNEDGTSNYSKVNSLEYLLYKLNNSY